MICFTAEKTRQQNFRRQTSLRLDRNKKCESNILETGYLMGANGDPYLVAVLKLINMR
jgi:hypothetical protein